MSRRLTTAAALAVLGVAMLPAVPAFASAASSATLAAGQAVYPGADRPFTVRVTNNEAALFGKAINVIRVNLPVEEAGIRLGSTAGSAPGFSEARATDLGQSQFLTYRGGSLRPGSSVDITFPARVLAPQARDLLGDLRVQVSSDGGATFRSASGSLLAKVQVLEILQEGLKPVAPTSADGSKGVTDRTGTAGQDVTYATSVKNHAQSALQVTANVASAAGDTSTPVTVGVPAGGTAVASVPVTLGSAAADRATTFTSTATAPGATAPAKTDVFTVQAPATLSLSNLQPTRAKSGTGSGRDFTVAVAKAGSPALDVTSSVLSIGTDTGSAKAATFGRGGATGSLAYTFASLTGTDGSRAASARSAATDDNLATYALDAGLGNVVIDNLAPIVDVLVGLPNDRDGRKQTAIKNGDTVSVSGTIANAGDLAAGTLRVVLNPDVGREQVVPVTLSGTGENRTFSGSLATAAFDPKATSFTVAATAADTAGNSGGRDSAVTVIDNVLPKLDPTGVVLRANEVEVVFADTTGVFAGCNAAAYRVDGVPGSVTAVRASDASDCAAGGAGGRILTLRNALAVDATPQITYSLNRTLVSGPAKDGAGNDALTQTVQTVSNLVPLVPGLVTLERRDGAATAPFEPAYLDADEKRYYTNVGGTDALQLTVSGIRQGYTAQVLRGTAVVASKKFTEPPAPFASAYEGSLLVPLPTAPGTSDLSVRFLAANGRPGDAAPFSVALDQALPTLGAARVTSTGPDGSVIAVPFSEKVVKGSDLADDWFVSETVATETGTARRTVNAESVAGSTLTARTLTATLADPARFSGVDYFLQSPSGVRYEDRAGNLLANTLTAVG